MKSAKTSRNGSFFSGLAQALTVLALACQTEVTAAEGAPSEQSVRAAMVFNFLRFTDFPPESTTEPQRLRVCFSVGDAGQADALMSLSGRKVSNRELVVARLSDQDNCQVLYVDSRQRWHAAAESRNLANALTISGYPGFVEDGGVIEIDLQADGNRFAINLAQARSAHLRMSPQLLRLARRVHE